MPKKELQYLLMQYFNVVAFLPCAQCMKGTWMVEEILTYGINFNQIFSELSDKSLM